MICCILNTYNHLFSIYYYFDKICILPITLFPVLKTTYKAN